MRMRLSKSDIAFAVFVAVMLVALVLGIVLPIGTKIGSSSADQLPLQGTAASTGSQNSAIVAENALQGTSSWEIPNGKEESVEIQAYASARSVSPGQQLTFYVSTQLEGTPYSIGIYRLGWYRGLGGRLMDLQANQVGHAQGYYDGKSNQLVGCPSCYVDTRTGLVEARWRPSYTLTIPPDWTTGVYLAKFVDANGMQSYAPFDVRGNPHAAYIVVTTDTTDAAYNIWGGYSLYSIGGKANTNDEGGASGRAVKVSFDRPFLGNSGSGYVLAFEADAIRWLERQGYDLSYMSSVDLHENPAQLLQHRAYLSLGHDEYWTKEMRDGVENARDHGVGLAFLGADAAYWQMRFEPDSAGIPDRTIVSYKVETGKHDLSRDPLYGKDNTRVTSQWRDPVLARPENALIGIMYSSYAVQPVAFPWRVSSQVKAPLLDGAGLQPGQQYGCQLVGYEWDRVFGNGATPAGLQVLGTSSTVSYQNTRDVSNTTYYIAPSGATVFATGSVFWTASLDSYRFVIDSSCAGQSPVVPGMQQLMARIMIALAANRRSSS